jgi:DNA-binding MarR family transcriptional regulator
MVETDGLDKLLFELASESRLGILRELQTKNLKMQEVARQLDLTATDAFRQLQRLSEASLIQRQPDGAYTITHYGRLVLQSTSSLEFLEKHREYFLTHDIRCLPGPFVNRIGELSQANLNMDSMENINRSEQIIREAQIFFWGGGGEQPLKSVGHLVYEQMPESVRFRFLFPANFLPDDGDLYETPKNIEWRRLADIPVTIVLSEKEGGIAFRLAGGRADYAGFIGKDPVFRNWVKDLFLYYWERGMLP